MKMRFDCRLASCSSSPRAAPRRDRRTVARARPPTAAADSPFTTRGRDVRLPVGDGFPARIARPRSSPKSRAASGWSTSQAAASSRSAALRGSSCRARADCSTSRCRPTFASDKLVYLTYSEPSANGGSGLALARAKLVRERRRRAPRRTCSVLWHDPAGGEGGQFGAIIAFAPDGKSLFLSSGERQRFTPAQDPSQPLGKILHLTLDGKPAPGNPMGGTDRRSERSRSPIRPRTRRRPRMRRDGRFAGPGRTSLRRRPGAAAIAIPMASPSTPQGRLWETEMGPRGGDELNLILPGKNYGWPLVSEGKNYDGVPIPPTFDPPGLRAAEAVLGARRSRRPACSSIPASCSRSGRAMASSARCPGKALIRVHLQRRPARRRPTNGTWATASAGSAGAGRRRSICSRTRHGARLLRLTPAQTRR